MLALGVEEARAKKTALVICSIKVGNLDDLAISAAYSNRDAMTLVLAQVLRQRLPPQGALARLAPDQFCALIPAKSAIDLENALAKLTFPTATVNLPDKKLSMDLPLSIHMSWLADLDPHAGPEALWAQALRSHSA